MGVLRNRPARLAQREIPEARPVAWPGTCDVTDREREVTAALLQVLEARSS
jgi:hypothetical protein